MPACQLAFAIDDELACTSDSATATPTTRFNVFSATKAVVGGVVWQLIGEGRLSSDTRAIELIPGFGTEGRTPEWMAEVTLGAPAHPHLRIPVRAAGPPRWDTRELQAGGVLALARGHRAGHRRSPTTPPRRTGWSPR